MKLSTLSRKDIKNELKTKEFDLVVIGGGITGAGIALDAASRGLKTAIIEKNDYASGTSSRSTKLIHGGLRYLKQFEIALVREVGRERAIVHKLAPHLVTAEKMLIPIIKGGTFGKFLTSVGLMVYDVLAGVEKPDQRKMLSKEEALEVEPMLFPDNLEGAGYYAEYRTDDARLTIEVIKTAAAHGASCLNYTSATDFVIEDGLIAGIKAKDHLTDEDYTVKSKYVVSAAGPWVDELRNKNNSLQGKRLHLTKGVHIVVPHERMPLKQAVYIDVFDGRMIFCIPRGKITYIGTTDTDYNEDKNWVTADLTDVDYLIKGVNDAFPQIKLERKDVVSSWAGLRPLIHEEGKSASELSRKDEIFESETGLISIAGGKLTGYRKMAERIVDKVIGKFNKEYESKEFKKCHTDKISLTENTFRNAKEVRDYERMLNEKLRSHDLDFADVRHLVHNYGKQSDEIVDKLDEFSGDPMQKLIRSELDFTINQEQVVHIDDFYVRRSGRVYFDIESVNTTYNDGIDYLVKNLSISGVEKDIENDRIRSAIELATVFK